MSDIQLVIEHIKALKKTQEIKVRNDIQSIDDDMINKCFNVYDSDRKKGININYIDCSVNEFNKEFNENHNKMILLSLIYCLSNKFRELTYEQQLSIINEMMNINIKNCICTRNDKNIRFYKLDKKSITYYYKSDKYSNAMIDLYANIFNINIFLIEYKDGRYPIGFYSMNCKFNSYKPSIILWHPNNFMYCPISINYDFTFYNDNKLFNKFIDNKMFVIDPLIVSNNTNIKDINISNEVKIEDCYDGDVNIICKYKTAPIKKAKIKESSVSCTNEETEQNVNDVVINTYDKETLKTKSKTQLEELCKQHHITLTTKTSNGKYVKKTKEQLIETLINFI